MHITAWSLLINICKAAREIKLWHSFKSCQWHQISTMPHHPVKVCESQKHTLQDVVTRSHKTKPSQNFWAWTLTVRFEASCTWLCRKQGDVELCPQRQRIKLRLDQQPTKCQMMVSLRKISVRENLNECDLLGWYYSPYPSWHKPFLVSLHTSHGARGTDSQSRWCSRWSCCFCFSSSLQATSSAHRAWPHEIVLRSNKCWHFIPWLRMHGLNYEIPWNFKKNNRLIDSIRCIYGWFGVAPFWVQTIRLL